MGLPPKSDDHLAELKRIRVLLARRKEDLAQAWAARKDPSAIQELLEEVDALTQQVMDIAQAVWDDTRRDDEAKPATRPGGAAAAG